MHARTHTHTHTLWRTPAGKVGLWPHTHTHTHTLWRTPAGTHTHTQTHTHRHRHTHTHTHRLLFTCLLVLNDSRHTYQPTLIAVTIATTDWGGAGGGAWGDLTCPASLQAVGEAGWGQRMNGGVQGLCTHLCRCVLRKIRTLLHFSWGFCKLMRTRYLAYGLTLYPNSLCVNNGNFSSAPKQASGLKIIFRNFRNVSNPSLW